MCSFFISGGDNIEFELSLEGVRQREICGGGAGNNREDTYQTTLYVPEDKAPGELLQAFRHAACSMQHMRTCAHVLTGLGYSSTSEHTCSG